MMGDFQGHTQLGKRLHEVAQKFAHDGGRPFGRALHARIAADLPNDKYASPSAIQAAKLAIYDLIDANDFAAADAAVLKMKSDFAGHELLNSRLESVGWRYDKAGRTARAREIFQEVIQNSPPTDNAAVISKARLAKYDLISAIESGNKGAADAAVLQLKSEFAAPRLRSLAMFTLAESLYEKALTYYSNNNAPAITSCLERATAILENEVVGKTGHGEQELDACVILAEACERLEDYARAMIYYDTISTYYPGRHRASHAQFMLGYCAEKLKSSGQISKDEADELTKNAYEKLLKEYPDCESAAYASSWLNRYDSNLKRRRK